MVKKTPSTKIAVPSDYQCVKKAVLQKFEIQSKMFKR